MLRSLFAGVAGLINHQTKLDVIGNNISNINTIGFKTGRVSFQEMLNQTVRGASRPGSGVGGTNAIQVGLGMGIASVDTMHTQGNLQATGNMFDMAFQGEGFFVIKTGDTQNYTRAGNFSLDGFGNLVHQSSGGIVQGYLPDADGQIRESSTLEDIIVDRSRVVSASASSFIGITGNLKADSEALPTITESGRYLKLSAGSTLVTDISQQALGKDLDVDIDDVINISGLIDDSGSTTVISGQFLVEAGSTLDDIAAAIESAIQAADAGYTGVTFDAATGTFTVDGHPNAGININDLRLSINGNPDFNSAFVFPSIIPGGAGSTAAMGQILLQAAEATDLMVNLFNQDGEPLDGVESVYNINGSTLTLQAYVGGEGHAPSEITVDGTTTLQDLMNAIQSVTAIADFGSAGISLTSEGAIRVEGNAGTDNEINSISIADASSTTTFGNTFIFDEIQSAKDAEMHPVSVDVYDSLGQQHHVTISFRKPPSETGNIEWFWEAEVDGTSEILTGGQGSIVFSPDGELVSFAFDDGSGSLRIDPGNGSSTIDVQVQTEIGSSVLTQTAGASTAKVVSVDGYSSGSLESVFVDERGVIVGQFSNGISEDLAQIGVAQFSNASGLVRQGSNLYSETPNSGRSLVGTISGSVVNRITPGALEMSNVNLAQEFTEMITAQRGFQANARIISTGDEMLNELVNIKR
jgi:flagellar hook protein FlgE